MASTSPLSSSASRSRRSPYCHWIDFGFDVGHLGVGGKQLVGAVGQGATDLLAVQVGRFRNAGLRKTAHRQGRAIIEHVDSLAGIVGILGVELHQHIDVAEAKVISPAADARHRLSRSRGGIESHLQALGCVVAFVLREKERGVRAVIGRVERDLEVLRASRHHSGKRKRHCGQAESQPGAKSEICRSCHGEPSIAFAFSGSKRRARRCA